jgi:hypothetical protein
MDVPISVHSLIEVVRSVRFRREYLEREFRDTPADQAHISQLRNIERHLLDFLSPAEVCAIVDPADDLRAQLADPSN